MIRTAALKIVIDLAESQLVYLSQFPQKPENRYSLEALAEVKQWLKKLQSLDLPWDNN